MAQIVTRWCARSAGRSFPELDVIPSPRGRYVVERDGATAEFLRYALQPGSGDAKWDGAVGAGAQLTTVRPGSGSNVHGCDCRLSLQEHAWSGGLQALLLVALGSLIFGRL